ncbi:MAG: chemotaxis response regulator protein-glutamate methylesterase [Sedimentisphaerales bacterium]|nr:chemotaxis response regulator protein-glutamate methylesterase [Sedimentisphaerales bacterium]
MGNDSIRVLVVDDTVTYRRIVSDILGQMDDIEVVGVAANGKIALQKIEQLQPDIITLDLEMPEVNGLEVLRRLQAQKSTVKAIMLSAFTSDGARGTLEALELGAIDFVLKPSADSIEESVAILKRKLYPKIQAFARTKSVHDVLSGQTSSITIRPTASPPASAGDPTLSTKSFAAPKEKPEIVVIGISTGGPQSLNKMLPMLPADLEVPVLIVQHMPPMFTKSLADDLDRRCVLRVHEAYDGQPVEAGHVYIAPGGEQMKVIKQFDKPIIQITEDPPENSCRPSVDYLFRSVAHNYGGKVVGVIMTGMGSDGTLGCRLLKRQNASIIAQDEATCVVYGMPKQPIEENLVDTVASLDRIAEVIVHCVRQGSVMLCR